MEFISLKDWLIKSIKSHVRKRCLHLRDAGNLIDEDVWAEICSWAEEHRFFPYKVKGDVDFRLQYEQNRRTKGHKPLILDQSPKGIFCPDLYAQMSYAEVHVSLHAYLVSATNDETWPKLVEAKPYRKILFDRLPQALEVYETFRARKGGFTDNDLKMLTLATFLELPFLGDNLSPETLWQLGVERQEQFRQAQRIFPKEMIEALKAKVKQVPKPFCDLLDDYPAAVRGILYLLILGQHLDKPAHYLASFDKHLFNYQDVESAVVEPLAQKIPPQSPLFQREEEGIEDAHERVRAEIEAIEKTLVSDKLDFLIDILALNDFSQSVEILKNESYSPLIASLALLGFLANTGKQQVPETGTLKLQTVFTKLLNGLLEIAQIHQQAGELAKKLASFLRARKQKPWETIPLEDFITLYVDEGVCQLDYLLSQLERARTIGEHVGLLSSLKSQTVKIWWGRIEENLEKCIARARKQLIEANRIYQQVFINLYPELLKSDDVKTTKDFVPKFLRKQIDLSAKKRVCILVFDGMRYDAWQLYVKPFFAQRYKMVCETPVFALLPSETKISRKALFSGKLPASFSGNEPENALLREALSEYDVSFEGKVDAKLSDRSGVSVAYTDKRFSAVIFNFTDQIFHNQKFDWDMAYTYAQHVSSILKQDVAAVIAELPDDTELFILSDHGFTDGVGNPLLFPDEYSDGEEAMYRYALAKAIPKEVEDKVLALSGEEAGLATSFVLFPKVGFLFKREDTKYQPPKFLHGGVSMQETIVPMAHLVKKREAGDLDVTVEREASYKAGATGKMTLHLTPRRLFLNLIFDITLPDGTQTQQPLFLTAGEATHEISFDVPALPEGEASKRFYLKIVGRDVETGKEMARLIEPVDVVKPAEAQTVSRGTTSLMDDMFKKKGLPSSEAKG